MKITIDLTIEQEIFLKMFSTNHCEGAKDNFLTYKPIHLAQTTRYNYTTDCNNDGEMIIIVENENHYVSLKDMLVEYFEDYFDEDSYDKELIKIEEINELESDEFDISNIIEEYQEKFDYYFDFEICYRTPYFDTVAYFWIRQEAERYLEYQAHNLHKPRVYTCSKGYNNYGEYEHFFDLLMNMGKQLTK